MRRGCISSGEVQCDECHRIISYGERCLAVDEKDGIEAEEGETQHYCVECCLQKGYAHLKTEKGEETLTFFPESLEK